jgi:hypothetical protein
VEKCEDASDSKGACGTEGFVMNKSKKIECFFLENDSSGNNGGCKTKVFSFFFFFFLLKIFYKILLLF